MQTETFNTSAYCCPQCGEFHLLSDSWLLSPECQAAFPDTGDEDEKPVAAIRLPERSDRY
jgi:hypothetical protein